MDKRTISKFAKEIKTYLIEHCVDDAVSIYYNGNRERLSNDIDWDNDELDFIHTCKVDENVDVDDYIEYHGKILTIATEGSLYDDINYGDMHHFENLQKIAKKYGMYFECGNAWNFSAYDL